MSKTFAALAAAVFFVSGTLLFAFQDQAAQLDEGFTTTKSGLKYKVLVQGEEGPRPDPAAKVTVHYVGMLENGEEFDSSVRRGRPVEGMGLNEVIRGWTEGLQLMTAGSKFRFIVPPHLGYGEAGRPPLIPGNANLVFEIELISFAPGPELPKFHEGNPEAQEKAESGLVYEIIKPGQGDPPKPDETCRVKYAIWSEDGTIRICTEMQEMPGGSFVMKAGGWPFRIFNEGLPLIKEGGRYRFIVPPEMAFGEQGMGSAVAPNETTIWEIEVVRVLRPLPLPEFKIPAEDALVTLDNGLKYEIIKEGSGKPPHMDKTVTVHYAGWLEDGTAFDSSFSRGEAATFPPANLIAGWKEGLQLMKEGAIYKFVIPPELAYGEQGSPPKIPANATLIFYVELIEAEQ